MELKVYLASGHEFWYFWRNIGENMFRTLIIDDEYHIRDTLINMLEMNCPDVRVVGQASGVLSGIEAIKNFSLNWCYLISK